MLAIHGDVAAKLPAGTRMTLDGESVVEAVRRTGRPARMDRYGDVPGSVADRVRELGIRLSAISVGETPRATSVAPRSRRPPTSSSPRRSPTSPSTLAPDAPR
jgi:hypothetical protein